MQDEPEGKEPQNLHQLIRNELRSVRAFRAQFPESPARPGTEHAILAACILVNLIVVAATRDYVNFFIAASFYLNMFYFISLLIPMNPRDAMIKKPDILGFFSWLKERGIITGTSRFTRLFINSVFINSRALSAGIAGLFSVDVIFCLIGYLQKEIPPLTTLIVIGQALIIIAFYLIVWMFEPFSTRFAQNVQRVRSRFLEKIPSRVVTALFLAGFMISVLLFLTTIVLLPGMTLSRFVTEAGLSEIAHLVILVAVIGISQYFIVRYIHGITSRRMAIRLLEYKERSLHWLMEGGAQDPIEETTVLLESRIYQIDHNSLGGFFEVYVVNLDFSVVMDSTTLTTITGYIREDRIAKKILWRAR